MQPREGLIRRLLVETGVSFLVWGALWLPAVYNAQAMGRTQNLPTSPQLPLFVGVRYAIFAILSVALFEFAVAVPFRKGARVKAAMAYLVAFPILVVLYAALRVLALRFVHGFQGPLTGMFLHQISGQLQNLLMEQLWAYGGVVLVAHVVVNQRAARAREMKEAELRAELARQQLQILRLQLHPHFLFNALHGISALMDTDIERARSAMAHFSDLLRTALSRTSADEIPLRDELAFLDSYIALEMLRLGERLSVRIDVPRDLHDAAVPTMVLQPLVENAIRHGVEHRRGAGRVDVRVHAEGDRLRIRVINDAGGPASGGAGIGLRNTRGRLHALYGSEQELLAGPLQDDRFEVSVAMPLRIIPAASELAS